MKIPNIPLICILSFHSSRVHSLNSSKHFQTVDVPYCSNLATQVFFFFPCPRHVEDPRPGIAPHAMAGTGGTAVTKADM